MAGKLILILVVAVIGCANGALDSGDIYSVDNSGSDGGKILSITVNAGSKSAVLQELASGAANQRFIARPNTDNTFTLFSEKQPWNWVEHIVERTKNVNIQITPQVLGVVGGTKAVVEEDYAGKDSNGQKWYIVPTGSGDDNTGVITNMLLRQCIAGQGENQPLTIAPCNWSDPNQIFTFSSRSSGRFS